MLQGWREEGAACQGAGRYRDYRGGCRYRVRGVQVRDTGLPGGL